MYLENYEKYKRGFTTCRYLFDIDINYLSGTLYFLLRILMADAKTYSKHYLCVYSVQANFQLGNFKVHIPAAVALLDLAMFLTENISRGKAEGQESPLPEARSFSASFYGGGSGLFQHTHIKLALPLGQLWCTKSNEASPTPTG